MHEVEIPSYVIDRIMAKRSKLEVFDYFEMACPRHMHQS